jgi:hypothetical protein
MEFPFIIMQFVCDCRLLNNYFFIQLPTPFEWMEGPQLFSEPKSPFVHGGNDYDAKKQTDKCYQGCKTIQNCIFYI